MIILETSKGNIEITLDFDNTPNTAKNFSDLIEQGYYDNSLFHRVIDGFMVQGGGFSSGMKPLEEKESIENEADKGGSNVKGSIAMARTSDPHSASTQFFINSADNLFLNHKSKKVQEWGYCVFGKVINGLECIESIQKAKTSSQSGHQDVPIEDIMIIKAYTQD